MAVTSFQDLDLVDADREWDGDAADKRRLRSDDDQVCSNPLRQGQHGIGVAGVQSEALRPARDTGIARRRHQPVA